MHPVDATRWSDLETLFGPSGAYSGCWCMWWRISSKEFSANGNPGNHAAFEEVVCGGEPVGLLGYAGDEPVGWVAAAPRPAYPRVLRSPALKPKTAEEASVWSVTCFFIHRGHRRTGVAGALLKALPAYARSHKASILEAYPVDTSSGRKVTAAELYTGTVGLFSRAGFTVHERPPTGRRVIMRRKV